MVVRKTFIHDYDDNLTSSSVLPDGIYNNASQTLSLGHFPVMSKQFINDLYETIVAAGYTDAVLDEDKYKITVLGFSFLCIAYTSGYNCCPYIMPFGMTKQRYDFRGDKSNGAVSTNYTLNGTTSDIYKNFSYNIIIRGDSNGIHIYYGSYNTPNGNYPLFFIQKGKDIINNSNIFIFGRDIGTSTTYYNYYLNENASYEEVLTESCIYVGSGALYVDNYYSEIGVNTKYKYVCHPLFAYVGNYIYYSMIRGNSVIFTPGNYYKLGTEVYYCTPAYHLYKVE